MTILATVQLDEQVLGDPNAVDGVVQGITQALGNRTVDRSVTEQGVLRVELVLVEHAALLARVAGVAQVRVARAGHVR